MRLKRNRLRTVIHKSAVLQKDSEGNAYVAYGSPGALRAEVWPAGGKVQAERYGLRLPNIRNLRLEERYQETERDGKPVFILESGTVIAANDGICFAVGEEAAPDYQIIGIYPYRFLTLEIERRQ